MQNTAIVLKSETCEFQNGEEKIKRISNHWPDSVVANIHVNEIEVVEKEILVVEG